MTLMSIPRAKNCTTRSPETPFALDELDEPAEARPHDLADVGVVRGRVTLHLRLKPARVLGDHLLVRHADRLERLVAGQALGRRAERLVRVGEAALRGREVQALLRAEEAEEVRLRDADLARDDVRRCTLEPCFANSVSAASRISSRRSSAVLRGVAVTIGL